MSLHISNHLTYLAKKKKVTILKKIDFRRGIDVIYPLISTKFVVV